MSIPFTQYLRPYGRPIDESIERPPEIEQLAQQFIAAGGRFEAEVLTTGHVSLTAAMMVDGETGDGGEMQDIAIRVVDNGPAVLTAVDELVREAAQTMEALP
jgi:hypothetical protein